MSRSFLVSVVLLGSAPFSHAESAKEMGHDAKRSAKKTWHRVQEKVCAEGDAACLAKKAKHRGEETKDFVEDKVDEATDKK